jgi:hypothetical protein
MLNPNHLARLRLGDLFLDTFPYGAHTTASDALWMGMPVLTLRGRSFASRVCASLVSAAGLPEMVCDTADAYVARAISLANSPAKTADLRARLVAGRDTCTLFDTPALVRSLEGLYHQMFDAHLAGRTPRPDLVNLDIYHEIAASEDLEAMDGWTEAAYQARYRERLAGLDAVFPVQPDCRFWQNAA